MIAREAAARVAAVAGRAPPGVSRGEVQRAATLREFERIVRRLRTWSERERNAGFLSTSRTYDAVATRLEAEAPPDLS